MLPLLGGVAASIAAPIIGGLFQRSANRENAQNQREFAQMGIQWRVADAKAAGLHPLYALGGGGATYQPSAQPLMTGADVARAADSIGQLSTHQAQLRVLEAQAEKDFALAAAARSETARSQQAALAMTPPVAQSFPVVDSRTNPQGFGQFESEAMMASRMAGNPQPLGPVPQPPPAWYDGKQVPLLTIAQTPSGPVYLPSAQAAELLESMESFPIQAYVGAMNAIAARPLAIQAKEEAMAKAHRWFMENFANGGARRAIVNLGR